jgi:P-type Cu2+ transporter
MGLVKETWDVEGMTCASCATSVQNILSGYEGVRSARVNLSVNSVIVEYDDKETGFPDLDKRLRQAGYSLTARENTDAKSRGEKEAKKLRTLRKRFTISAILTLPVFIYGMFFMHAPYANWIMMVLTFRLLWLWDAIFS